MNYIFLILCFVIPRIALAETFYSDVHSIETGKKTQPYLVRFNNGRVGFLSKNKNDLLLKVQSSHDKNQYLKITTDKNNIIQNISHAPGLENLMDEVDLLSQSSEPFRPTVVKNLNEASKVFRRMRRDYTKGGECFNRAHIWTVEEYQKTKNNLSKIYMFFTERYIRKYKFHWWFHVTPMVYVKNLKSPRTLDRRYTSGPRQTKTWSDTFVKSKRRCKIVTKFDDFFLNQKSEDCYHIYSSMYYYVPRDLEKRDLTGIEKTEFLEREIKKAYKNGFKVRASRQ